MADLYGKKGLTRYNWKYDAQFLLRWIEENSRVENGVVFVTGELETSNVNRMRSMAGWTPLNENTQKI